MRVLHRTLARGTVAVALLVAATSLTFVPQAVALTSPKPLNDTRPVGSGPVEVDFPIEYFGVVADLTSARGHLPDRGLAPYGEARFRVDGRWTSWRALEQDGAQAAGHFTSALLSVDRADAYQVRGLPSGAHDWRAAAINSTDGPKVVVGHRPANAAVAAAACRSRADWGADESLSGWANGDTPEFSPAQVLTIHHTAGSNDLSQDYSATVRAIYSYHVKTNGWSDIGYQYLVDGHGVLYEGRSSGHTSTSCLYAGGDGSDFAHQPGTDEVVTGAHVSSYNPGNIGISVMGCFEPGTTACTGDTQPTAAAVSAVESELARLTARHGLDPDGTVHYVNPDTGKTKDVPTIVGHRDWAGTACPGGNLYAQLPTIRSNVASTSVLSFRRARTAVAENVGSTVLTVVRSGNAEQPVTVDYARTSGSATPGTDITLEPGTLAFAAGETTKTIPLTVTDDTDRETAESIDVTLTNPVTGAVLGTPASTRLVVAASDQRPDGWISTSARSGYVGDDVYNTSGSYQTRTQKAHRTQTRTFYVRVYNDGNVKNAVVVTGSQARSGSTVKYFVGTTNITRTMRSAAGWTVNLEPGASKAVKVTIAVSRKAAFGSLKPASVRATWTGDGTRVDLVKAVVKVVR